MNSSAAQAFYGLKNVNQKTWALTDPESFVQISSAKLLLTIYLKSTESSS